MPSRIIRDSIRTSPTLDELSDGAERMFWRLVTVADDYGRFEADPRVLLSQCFPLRVDRLKVKQIAEWFEEMVKTDLARCYQVNGRTYGYFPTWEKYQRIRAKESRYPAPPSARNAPHEPASAAESDGVPASADICPQDADIGEHPPLNAPVVKGYGVWGIEDTPPTPSRGGVPAKSPKGKKPPAKNPPIDYSHYPGFERLWAITVPRQGDKGSKKEALTEWLAIEPNPETDLQLQDQISGAYAVLKNTEKWRAENGRFVTELHRWLKHRRWEGVEPEVSAPSRKGGLVV